MTSMSLVESSPPIGNPIDLVEEIVVANDWAHVDEGDRRLAHFERALDL